MANQLKQPMELADIIAHLEYSVIQDAFESKYYLVDYLEVGNTEYHKAKQGKNNRQWLCRFCGKDYTQRTFTDDAHLVSRFLGNTNLYSRFECDVCNKEVFNPYETDLANYIGISRTILGLNDEGKGTGFDAKKLKVRSRTFIGDKILILSKKDINEQNTPEDRKGGRIKLTYTKSTYTPSKVHKALTKAALSILSGEEVTANYQLGLLYLRGIVKLEGAFIYGYHFPISVVNMPLHVYVFQKKDINENLPTHIFGFYFQNHVYYLPLSFHKDEHRFSGMVRDVPYAPPYFPKGNPIHTIGLTEFKDDLSSNQKRDDDEETVIMQIDPNDLEMSGKFDPLTRQSLKADYNPNTKYLIIMLHGKEYTEDEMVELSNFIRAEEEKGTFD